MVTTALRATPAEGALATTALPAKVEVARAEAMVDEGLVVECEEKLG